MRGTFDLKISTSAQKLRTIQATVLRPAFRPAVPIQVQRHLPGFWSKLASRLQERSKLFGESRLFIGIGVTGLQKLLETIENVYGGKTYVLRTRILEFSRSLAKIIGEEAIEGPHSTSGYRWGEPIPRRRTGPWYRTFDRMRRNPREYATILKQTIPTRSEAGKVGVYTTSVFIPTERIPYFWALFEGRRGYEAPRPVPAPATKYFPPRGRKERMTRKRFFSGHVGYVEPSQKWLEAAERRARTELEETFPELAQRLWGQYLQLARDWVIRVR